MGPVAQRVTFWGGPLTGELRAEMRICDTCRSSPLRGRSRSAALGGVRLFPPRAASVDALLRCGLMSAPRFGSVRISGRQGALRRGLAVSEGRGRKKTSLVRRKSFNSDWDGCS